MPQPLRNTGEMLSGGYRYSFNGMEKDDEVYGAGNSYDFGARIYNPRIGRWMKVDPRAGKYPDQSPYIGFRNNSILFIDPDGRDVIIGVYKVVTTTVDGKEVRTWQYVKGESETTELFQEGLEAFMSTEAGRTFVAQFMRAGETVGGYTATENGALCDQTLIITEDLTEGGRRAGMTGPVIMEVAGVKTQSGSNSFKVDRTLEMQKTKEAAKRLWNKAIPYVSNVSVTITIYSRVIVDAHGGIWEIEKNGDWIKLEIANTIAHEVFIHLAQENLIIMKAISEKDFERAYTAATKHFGNVHDGLDGPDHEGYAKGAPEFQLMRDFEEQFIDEYGEKARKIVDAHRKKYTDHFKNTDNSHEQNHSPSID